MGGNMHEKYLDKKQQEREILWWQKTQHCLYTVHPPFGKLNS